MEGEQNNVNVGVEEGERRNDGGPSGPVIGLIVILAIIILGGLYFWNQRAGNEILEYDDINTQSEADNTTSIEADLDATDIENLDAELYAS